MSSATYHTDSTDDCSESVSVCSFILILDIFSLRLLIICSPLYYIFNNADITSRSCVDRAGKAFDRLQEYEASKINNIVLNKFHPHPLQKMPSVPLDCWTYNCDVCQKYGGSGVHFVCQPCGFTAHPSCTNEAQVHDVKCVSGHQMSMSDYLLGVYANGWKCDKCKVSGRITRWMCLLCTSDFCFNCIPEQRTLVDRRQYIKVSVHSHVLTLCTEDMARGGIELCNVCRKRVECVYICPACRWDICDACLMRLKF